MIVFCAPLIWTAAIWQWCNRTKLCYILSVVKWTGFTILWNMWPDKSKSEWVIILLLYSGSYQHGKQVVSNSLCHLFSVLSVHKKFQFKSFIIFSQKRQWCICIDFPFINGIQDSIPGFFLSILQRYSYLLPSVPHDYVVLTSDLVEQKGWKNFNRSHLLVWLVTIMASTVTFFLDDCLYLRPRSPTENTSCGFFPSDSLCKIITLVPCYNFIITTNKKLYEHEVDALT